MPATAVVDLDRLADVLALLVLRHAVVVDPAVAVARDLPARLDHRGDRVRVALERHRDAEDGDRDAALGEEAVQPPEADPAAVLVHRLDRQVALALPRQREAELRQQALGGRVAVEDRVLGALFVVDDELDRDAGVVRPGGIGRIPPVADHVPRVRRGGSGVGHAGSSATARTGEPVPPTHLSG